MPLKAGSDNPPMEFFFPEDGLERATPEETRITSLTVEPYPDGDRLRVHIEMTPFQKRPHLELSLTNSDGDVEASTSIVEPMTWKLEITLHRFGELRNPYTLDAKLYYPDGPSLPPESCRFEITPVKS